MPSYKFMSKNRIPLCRKVELVRLGEYNYKDECEEPYPDDFTVSETFLYPEYKYPEAHHDLALLKLSTKITIQVSLLQRYGFTVAKNKPNDVITMDLVESNKQPEEILSLLISFQDNISPVCLPWGEEGNKDIAGQQATVTGWGLTKHCQFYCNKNSILKYYAMNTNKSEN